MKKLNGFKGFDKDLKCRDYQFEIGRTEKEKEAVLCNKGFHFCENPLDVFGYYPPSDSRFCVIEAKDVSEQKESDSKRCSKKLTVKAEIGLSGLIKAGVEYIIEKVDFVNAKESNTGDKSAATNTGNYSAATNTGDKSAATNTGNYSAATNTGDQSAATNTGYQSAATNTGDKSAATNTGAQSAATNTGYRSAATNTGDQSAATNTGDQSAATNTGARSAATNTGDQSAATTEGTNSVAVVCGYKSKARAIKGSAIVVCERDDDYNLVGIKAAIVDGVVLKENTFYFLVNGEFVEEI